MGEIQNYLPQNIKSLRTAYGETQMELAFAIGLDGPTAISNYESGSRTPKPDVRRKIAAHFRLTEDQLMYVDMSGIRNISSEILSNADQMTQMSFVIFPIICSETAMQNESFAKGYHAHIRIKQCLLSGQEPDDKDYDTCFDSYICALEKYEIPEAAGNILSFLFPFVHFSLEPQISDGAKRLMEHKISGAGFLRQCYLKNFDFEPILTPYETSKLTEIDETIQDLLKKLQSSRLVDLAYYYMAIRYIYGIVKNELSQEMNQAIGQEMLWALSKLGNAYANDFFQKVIKATR